MKAFLILVTLFFSTLTFGQDTMRVLFLGNSYTNYNNLPQMVANLAASAGDNLIVGSNTPGGYTLNGHSTNATSLQLIAQGNWDIVVVQEQSQVPSFPINQVNSSCFPYATTLDSLITAANPCTETMFYNTWGRENGDASNCATWPPVCTYEGMDDLLRQRYDQMATDNNGVVSPVGPLWRYIRTNNPGLQLYASDGSHPSLAGSYAAACSFYSTIFRKDPTLITDDAGVGGGVAISIRNSAKAVVYDSLDTWHIGEYDPIADGSVITSFLTGVFTNNSSNATSYVWNFGDGDTSILADPIHVFSTGGNHIVTLIAENCGKSDTTIISFNMTVGLNEVNYNKTINVHPNPTNGNVIIDLLDIDNLTIVDALGKETMLVPVKSSNGLQVNLTSFSAGIYWLKIESEGEIYQAKVLKKD